MTKFGRLVDLETLQMMTGSRKLEELKQEKLHLESVQAKDVQEWEASSPETEPSLCHLGTETAKTSSANVCCKIQGKIEERLEALTAEMKNSNEHLFNMTGLWEQKKGLEPKLNARQKKIVSFSHRLH